MKTFKQHFNESKNHVPKMVKGSDGSKEWYLNGKEYTHNDYFKELYNTGKLSYEDYVLEVL